MEVIKITLDLPPSELQPNARPHWRVKAKKVKEYRKHACQEAMAAAYEAGIKQSLDHVAVQVRYYNRTARVIDRDNIIASLKSAFDGFTDAGIWKDDRDCFYLPVQRFKDAGNPRVEVDVRAVKIGLDELIRKLEYIIWKPPSKTKSQKQALPIKPK